MALSKICIVIFSLFFYVPNQHLPSWSDMTECSIVTKCHSMRVMRHSPLKQIKYSCFLYNQTLEQFTLAKYLGITTGVNMFQTYQLYKATQTLGFLHRNLALVSRETKDMAYKTLVRPKLECASPVWNPYSKSHVNQLETVQRIA